jgi:leucyl aminopeptidase
VPAGDAAQAVAEGVTIANYDGAHLKTSDHAPVWLDDVLVAGVGDGDAAAAALAAERGVILGEATNQARALANEPGNRLTPRVFADRGAVLATSAGLTVEILDEAKIADLRMGLLLSIAQGSHEPPRMLVLRHETGPRGVQRYIGADREGDHVSTPAAFRSSRPTTWTR